MKTKSIKQIQQTIAEIMAEMNNSDFRGLTSGNDIDYDNAYEHLKSAHICLGIAAVKESYQSLEVVSSCCSAKVYDEVKICSACKEHCSGVRIGG